MSGDSRDESWADTYDDPRIDDASVRRETGPNGNRVTVVGVVHDHPASVHRVRTLVGDIDPAVLALEVPPLAVPLFERYAATDRSPPPFGGEMSAAIQAAGDDATVVGIDGPTPSFVWRLARRLVGERAATSTVRSVFGSLTSATAEAIRCRLAATVAGLTGVRVEADSSVDHDVDSSTPPSTQATDERDQVRRARAVLDVFEPSRAARYRDGTREAHMVDRLAVLDSEEVVAIVGIHHLASVADALGDSGE